MEFDDTQSDADHSSGHKNACKLSKTVTLRFEMIMFLKTNAYV
jgi:hypothetical protein